MGMRTLKVNITNPLVDVVTINLRLDAVEELLENEDRRTSLQKALAPSVSGVIGGYSSDSVATEWQRLITIT